MKNFCLSIATLLSFTSVANAEFVLGIEYPFVSNMNSVTDISSSFNIPSAETAYSYQPVRLKLGFGSPGGYNFSLYYQSSEISYESGLAAGSLDEIGLDYSYLFGENSNNFHPFVSVGAFFGSDALGDTSQYVNATPLPFNSDSVTTSGFKIGGGVSYHLLDELEFTLGADYTFRNYQIFDTTVYNGSFFEDISFDRKDNGVNITFGINYWPFADSRKSSPLLDSIGNSSEHEKFSY